MAKIAEIFEKSEDGDYIYRGEPECYEKVSSNLYREYEADIEAEQFDIAVVQEEILTEAKEYTHKTDEFEILTELQHHGGKTNLIDFTEDYLVALFFACDGNRDELGKVILLKKESEAYEVVKPPRTIARAGVQKSIFVQSPTGVVEPDDFVYIPADLKRAMLDYLQKHHDISTKTIYNDLQGFIENRKTHKSAYTEFYKGFTCDERRDSEMYPAEKQAWYYKAIDHYTEAINLKPEYVEAYANRGNAYAEKGYFESAIQDYTKAIDLKPEFAEVYDKRGNAYAEKGYFEEAIEDYNKMINLKPEYVEAYANRGSAYAEKGELDTAIQDYNKAIDLNPDFAYAYAKRGNAYAEKGELDTAIQDYNKAIAIQPEAAVVYYNRGITYAEKGELDTAIQDYNKAIAIQPEAAVVYYNRGITYAEKGELDTAIQDYNKAIDLNPDFAYAYAKRGEVWLHLSKWEKARANLITAKNMGVDIAAAFHTDYESVADFEAKHGVQVPADIKALLSPHFEEEIKQRSAVETKPLVLTEGPLDVFYIQRALDVLERGELLNSFDIEFVGKEDEKGTRRGRDIELNHFRNAYERNPSLLHRPILLLYDCDTQKENEQIEKLWVRSIPKNEKNTKVRKGIENLFPIDLFREEFYSESPTDDGGVR